MEYFKARTWPGTVMNQMLVWMEDTGGLEQMLLLLPNLSWRCLEELGLALMLLPQLKLLYKFKETS